MNSTPQVHNINYRGKQFEGTTRELAPIFRKPPYYLTMAQIASLLGQSRANVSRVLRGTSLAGHRDYPELDIPETYEGKTDLELAHKLNVTESYVASRRREAGIQAETAINMTFRHTQLIKSIWGDAYLPGINFTSYFTQFFQNNLKGRGLEVMVDFYIKGKVDNNSERMYRTVIRPQLKSLLKGVDIDKLIENEILIPNV